MIPATKISKPIIGLIIIFCILFLPQCITVPAMYETAEAKKEKRVGVSAQYCEGTYKGLCESTKYTYKYGGIRTDYCAVEKHTSYVESGFEAGASINGYTETREEPGYEHKGVIIQLDVRPTGKIVTPTDPVRLGLKVAPGLLFYGGISRRDGQYDVGGEIGSLSYVSVLLGIGKPEFLTMGYHYYPYLYYLPAGFSFLSLALHYKKYSLSLGTWMIPVSKDESEVVPERHFILGLGIHY